MKFITKPEPEKLYKVCDDEEEFFWICTECQENSVSMNTFWLGLDLSEEGDSFSLAVDTISHNPHTSPEFDNRYWAVYYIGDRESHPEYFL